MVRARPAIPPLTGRGPAPTAGGPTASGRRPHRRAVRRQVSTPTPGTDLRRLEFPARSLVVVGGLPGAGKTTLLERLGAVPGAVVLDSAEATRRYRRLPLPYRLLRPLVHLEHHAAIALAVLSPVTEGVVVHETAVRAASRRWLLALARLAGRPAHLLMLDVDATVARAGQLSRGRTISAGSQRRHAARWEDLRAEAARGDLPGERWTSVSLLDRSAADDLRELAVRRSRAAPLLHASHVAG